MNRATRPFSGRQGRIAYEFGSGLRSMSDSSIRQKPSIEDPSNQIPSVRAFSAWAAGMATFFGSPWISENWSLMNFTRSASIRSSSSDTTSVDILEESF